MTGLAFALHTGYAAETAELSFRLKRANIEELHLPGSEHYYDALHVLIGICEKLHDMGWDDGVPPC